MLSQDLKREFAKKIHSIGVFLDLTKSPGGKGFKLKKHQKQPDAPLSPFYLNYRLLQSDYVTKRLAVRVFDQMLAEMTFQFDRLAPIPEAIVPVVSTLSDQRQIPMITPRVAKEHGSGSKVDGLYQPGMTAALFDDVVTGADSKIESRDALVSAGLVVHHVFVLTDRQQGGGKALDAAGLTLHAAFTLDELLQTFADEGLVSAEILDQIMSYRANEAA